MEVIYGLIPGMILMGLAGVAVFFWAAKSGQFDDMEGEGSRILMDDDLEDEVPLLSEKPSAKQAPEPSDAGSGAETASRTER
ncbi:MAG: cbb3-type cytochrome oxidase maturation protein [Motiliproteus sp.]|jgi:cbb3-type cytochrome oxidase maturation protein